MKKPPQELVAAFQKWYETNPHSKNEDFYADTIKESYLSGLSKKAFIDFFYGFANEGGHVQSGGHRTSGQFRKTIEAKYEEFRQFVMKPFSVDFNDAEWLAGRKDFSHFGVGLATIFLNRVDKTRFPILNKKTADSLALFDVTLPADEVKSYKVVREAQQQLMDWFPQFKNFFRTDALNQFLIGEDEGEPWRKGWEDGKVENKLRYWLYAPGPKAKFWDECWQKKIMVYGADELTDLSTYESKDVIENALKTALGTKGRPTNDARAAWEFSRVVKPGDIVIAKKGRRQYIGYGVVTGGYTFDASRSTYRNIRTINWLKKGNWDEQEGPIVLKTLTDITKYPEYVDKLKKLMEIGDHAGNNDANQKKGPLNVILYGPPGTGKTYALRNDYIPRFVDKGLKRYAYVTFHQSYCYEDFIEGIKPVMSKDVDGAVQYEIKPGIFRIMAKLALDDPDHDYALLIDEINRGNVANIFGELISLIEEDKRKDAANELRAYLPYSRQEIVVPGNLYIIGAMNTADRSIEALDTALRRRFTFVAVSPNPQLIQQPVSLDVDLKRLLITMNARIEKLLDKDHCIGHSYLMTVSQNGNPLEELRNVFATKILPLLEEYFYSDPAKIGMILGEKFVKRKDDTVEWASGGSDGDDFEERQVYALEDPQKLTAEDFRTIYE
jgi:hypothetical protein